MTAKILDGRTLAKASEEHLALRVKRLAAAAGHLPVLATILVGEDPASATYVRMKGNACNRVGLQPLPILLPEAISTSDLLHQIDGLNSRPEVYGILLQHPVPAAIDERACFDAIAPEKDVDGVGCLGFGRMAMGLPAWGAATPAGIMRILEHYEIPLEGQRAAVVGRSPILGKPMAMLLLNANATVTICHSKTRDLPDILQQADLVVGALGRPEFIRADWVRPGAVLVDAGYHPQGCGDIELAAAAEKAAAYTPVPGGVGPMTINTLISQTVAAAEQRLGIS